MPSTTSMSLSTSSFTRFPDLPAELQVCIIEYAIENATAELPHIVTIGVSKHNRLPTLLSQDRPLPRVDRLFRNEAMRRLSHHNIYPIVNQRLHLSKKDLLFEPDRQILELVMPEGTSAGTVLRNLSTQLRKAIRFVHFRMVPMTFALSDGNIVPLLKMMRKLEVITVGREAMKVLNWIDSENRIFDWKMPEDGKMFVAQGLSQEGRKIWQQV